MSDNRSIGAPPEAANFDLANRALDEASVDPDLQEYDPATLEFYSERARIRAELNGVDWRVSVAVYLLFIGLAILFY
jgi:hypothetical protein